MQPRTDTDVGQGDGPGDGDAVHLVMPDPSCPGRWILPQGRVDVMSATRVDAVVPLLERVERAVSEGRWAAGFVSYDAAPAFDAALVVKPGSPIPLVWFALFDTVRSMDAAELDGAMPVPGASGSSTRSGRAWEWKASVDRAPYGRALARIHRHLEAGDSYQVNYTFRLQSAVEDDPATLFRQLLQAQPTCYAAFIETATFAVCSVSPELFFSRRGRTLRSIPMKGTAPRGRWPDEDRRCAAELTRSAKNRAENVMITDMIRNDLGRIAEAGTVNVTSLCDIVRYPTVWQMVSHVEAQSDAGLTEVLRALFPCASITGAPKVNTMEIIRALECSPRGLYTGALGTIAPGGDMQFSVAIRTVVIDKASGRAECGVGGGVVWDSDSQDEYDECATKAVFLKPTGPEFQLLETLRWDRDRGFFLDGGHLDRLAGSADYFGYAFDRAAVTRALDRLAATWPDGARRVRLLLSRDGRVDIQHSDLSSAPLPPVIRLGVAHTPVDSGDVMLYHKTTRRAVYERARSEGVGYDDMVLLNQRGEVTESTVANIVVRQGETLVTPRLACGLLPGVYRQHLLVAGKLSEAVLTVDDLRRADEIFLVNSVREWMPATLA